MKETSIPSILFTKRFLTGILIICLLIPLCSGQTIKPNKAEPDKPFTNSSFVEINKMVLHYRIWPAVNSIDTLPWVLMVHGMGGSTFSWEYNAPALAAEGFTVVAVDIPPFGYSDKNPNFNQSVDNRAGLLWLFLNRIHPDSRWNLIGHSMGGGIVQCMAIIHPERVEKVVYVDPALFSSLGDKNPYKMSILRFRPFEWIAVGMGNAFIKPKKIAKMLRSAYAQEPDPTDVDQYYQALHQKGFARALIRSTAKSKPIQPIDGKAFASPALAIWGDKDTWVPLETMQTLLDKIPSIRVSVIPGAGHLPMATHPQLFNQQVLHFLKLPPL